MISSSKMWLAAILLLSIASAQAVVRTGDPVKRGLRESDFPRIQELAKDVYSYEQLRSVGDERITTVSFIVVTAEGVLVADGQGSVEETKRLVDEIAKLTPQPITHLVIASDHGDHTAGNEAFPRGMVTLAHPHSKEALERMTSPVPMPTELVEKEKTLALGGREIRILFLGRAHTGGDLAVYLPKEKILFLSEAYLNRIFPAMRSAYPSEWIDSLSRAQAMDVELYVPGHGFVESKEILEEELEVFRRALRQVVDEVKRLHGLGLSEEQAIAQADFGELESWSLYASQSSIAVRKVYEEIEGKLK
jgi:glyoxylase-like metal-dependent hydrolase (beta-lactamase superfamily II)